MPKVTDLFKATKKTAFEYEGEKIQITYKADFYTAEVEEMLTAKTDKPVGELVKAVAANLVDWDLTDDREKKIPVSEKTLKSFPAAFVSLVFEAMVKGENLPN